MPLDALGYRKYAVRMDQASPIVALTEADAFIVAVARQFKADIQLAELALTHAKTDAARTMAARIRDDSERVLLDIARFSTRQNLPLTEPCATNQESLLQCMREMAAVDFDYVYVERVATHHRLGVQLLRSGLAIKNPEIAALATRLLAVIEARAKLSRNLTDRIDALTVGDTDELGRRSLRH
jgi:predicted outer membrane protein